MRFKSLFLGVGIFSLSCLWGYHSFASDRAPQTAKEELIPLPEKLQATLNAFCESINKLSEKATKEEKSNLQSILLPEAIRIEQSAYHKYPPSDELNIPFISVHKNRHENGWSEIWQIRKLNDDCYYIETVVTGLYFVQTGSGDWRLYHITDMTKYL
jgi:hypothetical protein